MNSDFKSKVNSLNVQQTSADFFNPLSHEHDESFSYEIEIQKEYLQRLKMQREKIQGLYSKYDVLLSEMKKKDTVIREKQDKMRVMDTKMKDLEINCQQMSMVQQQQKSIINQNMELKHRVLRLENQNSEMIEQMKLKNSLISDEKSELQMINDQLQDKVKSLNSRLLVCQQELKSNLDAQRKKIESLKAEHLAQVTSLNGQVNTLKNELMRKDETIHMMRLENEFMQQKFQDQEQNYATYLKDLEAKIERSQKQKKLQIQALRNTVEEKLVQITSLQSKNLAYKSQLQAKQIQVEELKKVIRQEKKVFDDDLFQLKAQMNNQKLYFREQLMYCENHIEKLQKKLNQSLKREKQLGERIKKHEVNQAAKRSLRQIERQQMEKINRILTFQ